MAQLHCYVPEEISSKPNVAPRNQVLTLSRILADLVKRDAGTSTEWPEGYFEIFGKWEVRHWSDQRLLAFEKAARNQMIYLLDTNVCIHPSQRKTSSHPATSANIAC